MLTEILDKGKDLSPYFGIDCDDTTGEAILLWRIQTYVESAVRSFVRHGVSQNTYVEYQRMFDIGDHETDYDLFELIGDKVYSGVGGTQYGEFLQLNNGFVRSVSDVREDYSAEFGQGSGDFGSSTVLTAGIDYKIELDKDGMSRSGRLIRINRPWSSKPGTIKVTYVAGFTPAELDDQYAHVKLAILGEIRDRFNVARSQLGSGFGMVKKETFFGDYQVEYAVDAKTATRTGLSHDTMSALQPIKSIVL